MKKLYAILLNLFLISFCFGQTKVFINEIHYDNAGTDSNEGVEIAGPSGTDLSTYALVLYNGKNSKPYKTVTLSGTIPTTASGFGAVFFSISGIQNGAPDGVALANNGTLIQFLSYEGSITAVEGVASGQTSTDIGVSEPSSTEAGKSLQLTGSGTTYEDFTWGGPSDSSFNATNSGQTFSSTASFEDFNISEVQLYPNPNSVGHLNIKTQLKSPVALKIYDTIGQLVLETEAVNNQVSIQNLNTGLYFVELKQHTQTAIKKLIVE
jgi:hypothetical protein